MLFNLNTGRRQRLWIVSSFFILYSSHLIRISFFEASKLCFLFLLAGIS